MLGFGEQNREVPFGSSLDDVWDALVRCSPHLESLSGSVRLARNGRIASGGERIESGDEIALLPPVGGG
ncbi:MAG: MoaD/ThiS family protein [Candidatus Eremiobacteraeota bacterium]|nr:MoaD/ThiS family protein [Candidatus Eremiobacteraeota bacterium]